MSVIRDAARWLLYPAVMTASLAALPTLLGSGVPLGIAPAVAAALAGAVVLAAERAMPYRREWLPMRADLVDDALFLLLVQFAVPLALAWMTAWWLQRTLAAEHAVLTLWPSHWPVLAQLGIKIVAGDFLRYWLHRAAHTFPALWRLHAVHHQPDKLYTTNVFRFHPLEKALQFLCDTLPFMLIGIGSEVLGYYFVFYAVSGLFQHSNCDLRLGWLNYIVSGPEVHRWHHSRQVAESNHNYAHSFVFWDLLFGTYFRPRGRAVTELGLLTRGYPRRFGELLAAPFTRRAP